MTGFLLGAGSAGRAAAHNKITLHDESGQGDGAEPASVFDSAQTDEYQVRITFCDSVYTSRERTVE